jgi:hypothetical protein
MAFLMSEKYPSFVRQFDQLTVIPSGGNTLIHTRAWPDRLPAYGASSSIYGLCVVSDGARTAWVLEKSCEGHKGFKYHLDSS